MSISFECEAVRMMLTGLIQFWRERRGKCQEQTCRHYIDAYQTVHLNIFGELVPEEATAGPENREEG